MPRLQPKVRPLSTLHHTNSTTGTTGDTLIIDGVTFHRDFTEAHFPVMLEASDGTSFKFNIYTLASVSTFFADLLSLPVTDKAEVRVIPLPSATKEGLALALNLLRDQTDINRYQVNAAQVFKWPPQAQLDGFLHVVKAYDLSVAAETLLMRSAGAHIVTKEQIFQRLVVAVKVNSPWLKRAEHYTLSHDLLAISDWARKHLEEGGYYDTLLNLHFRWKSRMLELYRYLCDIDTTKQTSPPVGSWMKQVPNLPSLLLDEQKIQGTFWWHDSKFSDMVKAMRTEFNL